MPGENNKRVVRYCWQSILPESKYAYRPKNQVAIPSNQKAKFEEYMRLFVRLRARNATSAKQSMLPVTEKAGSDIRL